MWIAFSFIFYACVRLVLFDFDVNVNSTFLIIMHKLPAALDNNKIDCN